MRFRSVSHRLVVWILGASATLFVLLSYYEYSTAEHFLSQQIKTKTHLAKSEMINRIDNLVHNVSDSVHTLAAVVSIEEADKAKIQTMLKRIVTEHQDIYGMAVAFESSGFGDETDFAPYYYHQGEAVAYEDLSKNAYDFRSKDWYARPVATGKDVWSEPYTDIGGGNIDMVTFSVPVYSTAAEQEQLLGVVTADISLKRLGKLVSKLGVGENGYAYIVSDEGYMITHSNPERVMTNVSDIPVAPENREQMQDFFNSMLAGNSATLQAPCRAKNSESIHSGQQCWVSYQPISSTGWSIAIVVPLDELNKTLLQYRDNSILITITGLLLLTCIVILISRRLTVPLLSLTQSSQALARGELDTEIPEFDLNDEVGSLARQFKRMQSALKDYIEQLNQETAQRERLQGELGAAHDIQMQMLPDNGKSSVKQPRWHLSAVLEPAKSVGGDLYYYQLLDDQHLFFAIADVSDKGVAAALFMAKTQTLMRQLCVTTPALNNLLTLINQQLCQDNDSCMFVTALCGQLNTHTGELSIASAGHSPPLLMSDDCRFVTMETGPALGFYEGAQFEVTTTILPLNSALILTTDGIDEAANPGDEHYGEERLQQLIRSTHTIDNDELLALILNDVLEFRADAEPSDDLTVMTITRH